MPKISNLPNDTSPTLTDSVPTLDQETTTTKRALLSAILALFFTQTNIPTGGGSPVTRDDEMLYDFVASGGVWTADSAGASRNASMSALVCYINGRRISISAVSARAFTVSKDTYIDVLDNADGTGTLVYTEAVNNAASSALAANSIRIGIIVTNATVIAAAASINQGDVAATVPVASSIIYSVTDSIGNLIYNTSSTPGLIGYRQMTANFTSTTGGSIVDVTALGVVPFVIPAGRPRKVRTTIEQQYIGSSQAAGLNVQMFLRNGAGTNKKDKLFTTPVAGYNESPTLILQEHLAAGTYSYKASAQQTTGGATLTIAASATSPAFISVELN